MATLSGDKKSITVEKNDSLWKIIDNQPEIAKLVAGSKIQDKINTIVSLNKLPDPDYIDVGQVLYISSVSSTSSSSKKKTTDTNKVTITHFGEQSKVERMMYAAWSWSMHGKKTKEYEVEWYYATGDGLWFVGNDSTTTVRQSTYSAPSNATKVKVRVKAVPNTYKSNGKDTDYFVRKWSTYKYYTFKKTLDEPTGFSAECIGQPDKLKLKASVKGTQPEGVKHIQFQAVQNNDQKLSKEYTVELKYEEASCSWNITAGNTYKVRCRALSKDKKVVSEWTSYTEVGTPPVAPERIISLKAKSETEVCIDFSNVKNADLYRIQYTTHKRYFDSGGGEVKEETRNAKETGHAEIKGLTPGTEYFFRVRAENNNNSGVKESAWTEIKSIIIGTKPAAPTTWSNTTTAVAGEKIILYWVHNSQDGSSQTWAKLLIKVDGREVKIDPIPNSTKEEEKDKTSFYELDTSDFTEGTVITWSVQTAGIAIKYDESGNKVDMLYSDPSIERTIDVYAEPLLGFAITDKNENMIEELDRFPFYLYASVKAGNQIPIGYHVSIVTKEAYKTVDQIGNTKSVNKDEVVYSEYFNIKTDLLVEVSAGNIDLENNITYIATCTVSMNSGLTAEANFEFTVGWYDHIYTPNAEIFIDRDALTATIRPFCEIYPTLYYKVEYDGTSYTMTDEVIDALEGISVDIAYSSTDDIIYYGATAEGENVYFCMKDPTEATLLDGVKLSVYRREFDGSFTEIRTDVNNNEAITDLHPALDYTRYRIVATTEDTGAVSFYDVPAITVGEKAAVIQWNESWSTFSTLNEDEMEEPPSSSSMLKLPYNIDVSDDYSADVSLVKYAGRKRPVSYYGTQLGESSTWNVVIEKNDEETLYALRRLALWAGDVYVREPSGSGYWANVTVSFSQKHCDKTIPVTLGITRVEGGA